MRAALGFAIGVVALAGAAVPAAAQAVWQDGRWVVLPRVAPPPGPPPAADRWPMREGRWRAGWEAPGGWSAYRPLRRGDTLPAYWRVHAIPDYLRFGLAAPPAGYGWVRYYDDAVLVDAGGRVWDSRSGIVWQRIEVAQWEGDVPAPRPVPAPAPPAPPGASYAPPADADAEPPFQADAGPPPPPATLPPRPRFDPGPGAPPPPYPPDSRYVACQDVCRYPGVTVYAGAAALGPTPPGAYVVPAGATLVIAPAPVARTTTTVTEEVVVRSASGRVLSRRTYRR